MRRLLVVSAVFLWACADVAPPPAPAARGAMVPIQASEPLRFPENFKVIFTREYGMWKYDECVLEIALFVGSNETSLVCQVTDGGRVGFAEQLSPIQAASLRQLVQAADIYGPNHVGQDLTPGDGIFETLRFQPAGGGRAAVVVTSGNDSFVNQQPRRELLRLLARIEADFRVKGRMQE